MDFRDARERADVFAVSLEGIADLLPACFPSRLAVPVHGCQQLEGLGECFYAFVDGHGLSF